jgi:general secretion pathway protein G
MRVKVGFTLLQATLLVAIIGTTGGIVLPEMTSANVSERASCFKADLQTMRAQLQLYRIQHGGKLPPTNSFEAFTAALTAKCCDNKGPYLKKVPVNPYNGDRTVRFESGPSTAGSAKAGWVLNLTTGMLRADDSAEHSAL